MGISAAGAQPQFGCTGLLVVQSDGVVLVVEGTTKDEDQSRPTAIGSSSTTTPGMIGRSGTIFFFLFFFLFPFLTLTYLSMILSYP